MKKLFEAFPPQYKSDWLAKVEKDLKGTDRSSLNWSLNEELLFPPFVGKQDQPEQFPLISNNRNTNAWKAGVVIQISDYKAANQQALALLNSGANALCFKLSHTPSKEQLSTLLDNIQLEWITTHFMVSQESWKQLTERFVEIIQDKGQRLEEVDCAFDVVGSPISEQKEWDHLKNITTLLPKGKFLSINTISQFSKKEKVASALAKTIKQGNDLLITLNEQGFDLKVLLNSFQYNISLTDSYLLNIATLRALRLLWQQVVSEWDKELPTNFSIVVHLNESTQVADENYNKIKATAQAMAAVIGGADRLYIYPSDEFATKGGSAFNQRIALNIQHLMQMESYLDRVVDPAAGSYYLEAMTEKLAAAAWDIFRK